MEGQRLRLVIVGDGPERCALEALCASLEIEAYVTFCGEQARAQEFYPLFDVFVLSSISEGISMTLLEAMSAKVPVVASAVGGNCEVIQNEKTGLLFPSQDKEGLADMLKRLMASTELRKRLSHAGYERVKKYFDFNHTISLYHQVYLEVL